jgi:hypothetical protein
MSWFAYFVFLSTWALLSYCSFAKIWTSGELFAQSDQPNSVQVSDFTTFYAAGEMAKEAVSGHSDLYNPEKLRAKINQLIAPLHMPDHLAMQYPPPYLLFLSTLSSLPLKYSWIVWSVISAIALTLGIALFAFPAGAGRYEKVIAIAYGLAWFPTFWCCWLGQNSQIVLFCLAGILYLLRQEKYLAAGLATSVGIFKIQYLPLVVVTGLVLGRWRYLTGVLCGYASLSILSVAVFGWANVRAFFNAVLGQEGNTAGTVAHMMDSVRGVLAMYCSKFLGDNVILCLSAIVLIIGMVATAWLWFSAYPRLIKRELPAFEICSSFTVITMLVTSLHCHTQDYVLLLLAGISIFVANRRMYVFDKFAGLKLAINVLLFAILPLLSWLYAIKFLFMICYLVKPLLLAAVLLLIMEAALVARQSAIQAAR